MTGNFFESMPVRWEAVAASMDQHDGAIPTKEFVEAARQLIKIFGSFALGIRREHADLVHSLAEILSNPAFGPVRSDMERNVGVQTLPCRAFCP